MSYSSLLNVILIVGGSTVTATTMTATNYDDQLGEIYPMMLNELNCTFGVTVSVFTFSLLWPSWSWFVAVMV